ncbi:MAG TPA: hypothetical protein VFF91_13375 [Pseudoxanthomonas sp.]|nr:hypothetical protein [Pseudoxanthomonas sp.]
MRRLFLFAVLGLAPAGLPAAGPDGTADNLRMWAIFEADQQARKAEDIDWDALRRQDRAHRAEVLSLLRAGALRTSVDYFNAGIVFQHGDTADDYRMALALAQMAVALDPDNRPARWLTAAAWDRLLMQRKLPQWYGTQYHKPKPGGPVELYPVDEAAVSDEERVRLGVPTLQEARARAAKMGPR